jgi:hypothetical protein
MRGSIMLRMDGRESAMFSSMMAVGCEMRWELLVGAVVYCSDELAISPDHDKTV